MFKKLGDHIIAELINCENCDNYGALGPLLRRAAEASNATILAVETHKFSPIGMSGIVLLQESHIALHTWPEYGYISADIFTCGEHVLVEKALDELILFFKPESVNTTKIDRGFELSTSCLGKRALHNSVSDIAL